MGLAVSFKPSWSQTDANSHELADNWKIWYELPENPGQNQSSTLCSSCFFTFNYLQSGVSCKRVISIIIIIIRA